MRCSIVPPNVLERIADRHADPALRDLARQSLVLDRDYRAIRSVATFVTPVETTPVAAKRTIYDANHLEDLPGDVVRQEGGPATGDIAEDQNYDWLGATFDLYAKAFGRNSIDGAGLRLKSTVHYGTDYMNAFWNGEQMVYGDGDGRLFLGFTGPIDVTGHELTHGVTQYTAGLNYEGQSGALNESLSDVFGSLVKQHHLGHTAAQADWLIGAGLLGPDVTGVALRSMKAPGTAFDDDVLGKDPQPGSMSDFIETDKDNGGVHINSGIPNRAFHHVAMTLGGNAWKRAGQIWYDTLTGGTLQPDTDFVAFATATIEAAAQRYGSSGDETDAVRSAWKEVGVKK